MKDEKDKRTGELIEPPITKEQRFRARQLAAGLRQYAFWLSEAEAEEVRRIVAKRRKS